MTRLKADLEKMKVQQEETLSRLQGKQIETKSKIRRGERGFAVSVLRHGNLFLGIDFAGPAVGKHGR